MPDGRIFYCHDTAEPIAFDPVTGQITNLQSSLVDQHCFSASLLGDGRIIAVGGNEGSMTNFKAAITIPKDSYLVPLGHYMLFAMVDDIPSVASLIQVNGSNAGDLNGSGKTDFFDFARLASFWLNSDCNLDNFWCNGADFTRNGEVNLDDLAQFITYWLIGVE